MLCASGWTKFYQQFVKIQRKFCRARRGANKKVFFPCSEYGFFSKMNNKREKEVGRMSRILRVFAFVVGIFYAGNVLAAGYTCPTYKQYTSCASGYYMTSSASSTVHNGTSAVGNACRPCSVMGQYNGVDKYTCAGGTAAPVQKTVTVSYNLNNGTGTVPSATTCKFGESCTLNAGTTTAYYRAGYRLVGWSTSSSATSGSFSMTLMANTTVYAVWSKCASGTYKGASATAAATCTSMSYGYYGTGCDANDAACTGQAQCTGTTYCEDHIQQECPNPNDATHQRTTIPDAYKGSKFSSAGVTAANGRGAASECRALVWYNPDTSVTSGQTVGLYEYVYLDDATMRYQGKVDMWAYDAVGPGYYLYGKGVCGAYAYYKSVAVCPIGAACLGKSKVLCDSSNQATVHTETFGLDVCSGGKTTTATGATACNATCSNATGANTWTTPTWSSSTKQILNKCAISTCSTGYTRGGTASSTATSSYTCAANCNKITLVGAYNGGSGTDLVVYKKTGSTTWYSNSTCTTAITKVSGTLPTKQYASYGGHFNTTAASGGTQCVDGTGLLSDSGSCNVNGDIKLYPQFSCWREYLGSGHVISGACTGTVYPITLRNYNGTATHSTIYEKYATGWYSNSTATTTLSKAAVPTRTGYTFRGFYSTTQTDLTASGGTGTRRITADGTLPSNTTFASNTSLYAAWATNCVQPSNGKCTLTINSAGTATYTTTCNAGYYISGAGTYKPTCTPCGDGTYSAGGTATSCTTCPGEYTHSDGARSAIGNCYLTTTAGKYVKTAGAGQVTCDDPTTFYYPGGDKVYYGKTGGEVALDIGEWNAVNVGGTCADKEYCPAGYYGDASGWCEPIPAGYYPEISGCYATDDDGNGIGCWSYEPCSGLPGVSVTGGTYTSAAQSKNSKACKYTAPAKTIDGCATVTSNTVSYTGSSWPASTYTVTPSAGYVASNNNTATATCGPGTYTITLDPSSQSGGTGGTSVIYEKYNTGFYSNSAATSAISTITVPTKSGYVFTGYETAKGDEYIDKTGKVTASNTTFTSDTTLYALFATTSCNVTNGTATKTISGNKVSCAVTCTNGYSQSGGTNTTTSFTVTGAMGVGDVSASCSPRTYKITYNVNATSGVTSNGTTAAWYKYKTSSPCYYYSDAATTTCLGTGGYTITLPVRTGYTFAGYYANTAGTGTQYTNTNGSMVNSLYANHVGDITLYAKWTAKSVTCDAGKYLPSNTLTCKSCDAGYYCAGGTYSFNTSSIQGRTACTAGTYNSNTGSSASSACVKASAGYYVPSAAAMSQTACTGATYTETTGATSCTACPTVDASVTPGGTGSYGYYNLVDNTSVHSKKDGCVAYFNGLDLEHGHVNNYRCYWNVNSNSYDFYCTVARGELSCDAGYFTSRYGASSTDATEVGFGSLTDRTQGGRAELTTTCRDAETGYYSPDGDVLRTQCPTGYRDGPAGATEADCKMSVAGGKYLGTAKGTTLTTCPANNYCPAAMVAYGSTNSPIACPTAADHKRAVVPTAYYASAIAATSLSTSTGRSAITQCQVLNTYNGTRGSLYDYLTYDPQSNRYDVQGTVLWFSVKPGYYLTGDTGCGTYAYYAQAVECDKNAYCPGKDKVTCNSTNKAEVHVEKFGLELCSALGNGKYATSDGGASATSTAACYLTTTATNYVATANAAESKCAAGNWCPGGTKVTYGATGGSNKCPNADSGWTATSPAGSSAYTACYEYQTPVNCASGSVKRVASSASAYGTAITLLSQLKSKAGYYASATATSCTGCPAGSYCPASATAATKCANWTYAPSTGMAACTACPALTSNWTKADSTGTGWTSYTSCVQISPTPAGCASGNNKQVAASNGATTWAAATINTALSAKAGYIVSGTTCAICTGATYSAGGTATSCTTCPSIYTSDKTDGKTKDSQCKVTTTAGQYIATAGDSTQTKCPVKHYCPSASVAYGTANSPTACPAADSTTERTTYPTDYLNPELTSFTQQGWSSGLGKITSCSANYGFTNEAGRFIVESVYYNETTKKYDTGGGKYYTVVNPGWYMVDKYSETYCDNPSNRMLYHNVAACPENYYCPGYTSIPLCRTGPHESEMGKFACSSLGTGVYTKSPAKSGAETACYLTTTSTKFVKTAKSAEETCTVGGYCPGGVKVNWNSTGGRTACTAGTYNPSTGSSAASACVKADAGYYVPSTGATSQTACTGATYTETTGATSCTACPTATGATSYSYFKSGDIHSAKSGCYAFFGSLAINNGTLSKYHCYWDTTNNVYNTTCGVGRADLKCNAKYYAPAFGGNTTTSTYLYKTKADITSKVCQTVGGGYYSGADVLDRTACPTGYGNGAAGAVNTDCQMKVAGGKYVKVAAESTASGVCAAGYAKAEHYVNYNSTSSCTACTGATYADTTGQASCAACPTAKTYASAVTGYEYYNSGKDGDHTTSGGCRAIMTGTPSNGSLTQLGCYLGTDGDYGNGGGKRCYAFKDHLKCDGGYYASAMSGNFVWNDTRAGLLSDTCVAVGAGYYSAADVLTRSQCPTGQTTIGYGAGADEAADCGRILHIGDDKVYLRNTKKTTPSLNVQIGDTKYYGDMTSGTTKGKLRVQSGTTTYSVHDDSM